MPQVLAPLQSPSSGVTVGSLPGPCAGSILGSTQTLHSPEPSGAPPSLACLTRPLLTPRPQPSWEATQKTASFVIRWLSSYEHNLPPQSQKRPCPLRTHHLASPSSEGPGGGGLTTELSNRKERPHPGPMDTCLAVVLCGGNPALLAGAGGGSDWSVMLTRPPCISLRQTS